MASTSAQPRDGAAAAADGVDGSTGGKPREKSVAFSMSALAFGMGGEKIEVKDSGGDNDRQAAIDLPDEYVRDIARTPEALESVSRICHLAARGDLEGLKAKARFLGNMKLSKAMSLDSRTPLHFAAAAGKLEVCEWLLEQGVPVNAVDAFGLTPLAEAVRWNHKDLSRVLHGRGGRLMINGNLVAYHNFDAKVPLLSAAMTDADWEIPSEELMSTGLIGQGSFGLIYRALWRGTPVAVKQIRIRNGSPAPPESIPAADDPPVGRLRATTDHAAGVVNHHVVSAGQSKRPEPKGPGISGSALERITAELRDELYLMSRLHHPHVLQFLVAVTKPGPQAPAIVMELARATLAQRFRRASSLPVREAIASAIHVARGMAYLHGHHPHPIIHRDLKPSNVLLTAGGVWKICDFGLSRLLPGKALTDRYHLTGETGSYVYMAPEVFRHESYSLKVDQYAYAMILYQAFEGHRPFLGLGPVDAARAASTGRRPQAFQRAPPLVRTVIASCWREQQDQRPRFRDIVAQLSEFAESRGLTPESQYTEYKGVAACTNGACSVA
mmetsp:Transcript_8534/g.29087  ORF Transcript_8534/g.29087 Transcript_8534/m.29087 type:complete len:555 (-) Transcript_8534:401-2065(-)